MEVTPTSGLSKPASLSNYPLLLLHTVLSPLAPPHPTGPGHSTTQGLCTCCHPSSGTHHPLIFSWLAPFFLRPCPNATSSGMPCLTIVGRETL